jgi:hypothetical protein
MATGHVEQLKRGFRAVVYAGKDPITGRKTYIKETHPTREAAEGAKLRLIGQSRPNGFPTRRPRALTCSTAGRRWPITS